MSILSLGAVSPQSLLKVNCTDKFPGLALSNRYIILDSLEQSIYGCVKLGYDKLNECKVAIKISCLNWSNKNYAWTGAKCLENIEREVNIMKYLGLHKNILNNNKCIPASPTQSPINSPRSYNKSKSLSCNSDDEYDSTNSPLSPQSTNNSILSNNSISSSISNNNTTNGSQYFAHLIDEFRDGYFHYLITEFISGGDLFNVLLQLPEQRMPIQVAKILFKQLISAINYLHNKGCAHLDLSLENICLRPNGNIAIIDFGLANVHPNIKKYNNNIKIFESNIKFAEQSLSSSSLCDEFMCCGISNKDIRPGKSAYMSYELINGVDWDAYSNDIFSCGVVLYTMTTGKPPFKEAKDADVWYHVISTGKWLTDKIRSQSSARVYNELEKDLLELLDNILKPQEKRAKLDSIMNSNWFNS